MIKNIVRKLLLGVSLAGIVTFTAAASACSIQTAHPKARITVEFNSETYELDYTLYRNMYPNTVRHFIELADSGYYNDMLVHNYGTQDWYTGGYSYDADKFATALSTENFAQYLEDVSKESSYMQLFADGKLTSTVYSTLTLNDKGEDVAQGALPTLIGEFKLNGHEVDPAASALKAEYGTLKMYYYNKPVGGKVVMTPTTDQVIGNVDYKYNCATSIFAMQVDSSSGNVGADNFAVFARIANASDLDELIADVDEYLTDTYGDSLTSHQTYGASVTVDNLVEVFSDAAADSGIDQTFRVTKTPIIIRSVKITKY